MNPAHSVELARWLAESGLAGKSEPALLEGFCRKVSALGIPLARAAVIIDTLHPIHEGRAFRWRRGASPDDTEVIEYGPSTEGEVAEAWRRSAFYALLETGQSHMRRRLRAGEPADFLTFAQLRDEGMTDIAALLTRFPAAGTIGEMDAVYSYWATDHPNGFNDDEIAALEGLVQMLGLAIKSISLARIADTLAETYLGRDAGRRVLGGLIRRGVAERIAAVLWYSDLRGYTGITDTIPADQVIPLLNDYAEAVISAVHDHGGDVLKLIGDGTLAIFTADTPDAACAAAVAAYAKLRQRLGMLNARRATDNLPVTDVYLGMHIGEVFYGNIGSTQRLDFTVVGPAVNEVARIAAMCRSAERTVLLSAAFRDASGADEQARLVSVGRYALRGVARPQELFTILPATIGDLE